MPKNKVSLIMTGAVSLGSFEAGAITELLYALDHFTKNGREYELDVITGASAGAMTAGLVANIVMNDFTRLSNLYKAWVEMVTIDDLLADPPGNSLLSRSPIERIAQTCLAPPFSVNQAARFAPPLLRMTLTLSNLNGLDRELKVVDDDSLPLVSTFFDDRADFLLAAATGPDPKVRSVQDPATWDLVRQCAIASGSFPLAFPPYLIPRTKDEYESQPPIARFESQPSYIDGGTFNNQPIGEAVRLSRQTAGFDFDEPRKYIFVNANSDNSVFRDHDVMKAITGDFLHLLERVAQIIFNQARVSDLLQALQINEQIVWRQQFLDTLVGLIQTVSVTDQAIFIQRLRDLAGSMVESSRARPGQRVGQTSLEDLLQRTRSKYAAWLQQIPAAAGQEVFTLIVFSIDHIADLNQRIHIDLFTIAPGPGERLAGEQLAWFGGFFKLEYRQYNFRRGRSLAHEILSQEDILGPYPQEQGDQPYQQYDIPDAWKDFPNEDLDDANRAKLSGQLSQRIEVYVENWLNQELHLPRFLTRETVGIVLRWILNREISKTLRRLS